LQKINILQLHPHPNIERTFYHFNFLRDGKIHGIYFNTISGYLNRYPFIKKDHSHDFFSLLLFTQGKGTIRINNNDYPVLPQSLSLISANQMHSFTNLGDADGIIFFFCQDFYVKEFSFIRLLNAFSYTHQLGPNCCKPCMALSDAEFISLKSIIDSIGHEYESYTTDNNSAVIICSLLNIILLKLTDLYHAKSGNINGNNSIIIHSLSGLVDSNFIQEQQIGFYASALNISETLLNELCKRHFNHGLKKILQSRLMQEARKLLLSSELSVSEIGYKLNFRDNSYFNKAFKNQTGITPKSFREMHKKLLP
jgi:AraC family transcriptional regulator, transcriptional activator of pobA